MTLILQININLAYNQQTDNGYYYYQAYYGKSTGPLYEDIPFNLNQIVPQIIDELKSWYTKDTNEPFDEFLD